MADKAKYTSKTNSKKKVQKKSVHLNARETALLIIMDVLEDGKYLKDSREKHFYDLRKNGIFPDSRDRSFINSLSKGVVERNLTLDYIIDSISNTPVKKMDKAVRNILRQAVFEIFYFDRTPDYSSINEAVNLTKKHGLTRLSGFVNGVLRNIVRHKDELISKINENPKAMVKYSIPNELFYVLEDDYGHEQAVKIVEAFNLPEIITARVMTQKISAENLVQKLADENIKAEKFDDVSIIIKDSEKLLSSKAFHEGLFYIQDLSSMMVEREFLKLFSDSQDSFKFQNVNLESVIKEDLYTATKETSMENDSGGYCGRKIKLLDLCSAPGGKSIDFSDTFGERIEIDSCDISEKKTKKVKENIDKFSFSNINIKVNDAEKFNQNFENSFDIVLCDVPCSGLGTCSHRPEIKYRQSEAGFCDLRRIQKNIIENASKYVHKDGFLIYSTCTLIKEENDEIVEKFLSEHSAFKCIEQKTIFPDELHDGFFIAILKRQSEGINV